MRASRTYVAELHDTERAASSAAMAVAAACFREKLAGHPEPRRRPDRPRVLAGYRREPPATAAEARPVRSAPPTSRPVLATCRRPRGRGVESDQVAIERWWMERLFLVER